MFFLKNLEKIFYKFFNYLIIISLYYLYAQNSYSTENILALSADITEQEGIDKVYDAMIAKWGRCDILVSNCGGK